MKSTIGRKLLLGTCLMLLLVTVSIVVSMRTITVISDAGNEILEESVELAAIQELKLLFQQLLMPANDYLIHGHEDEFSIFQKLLKETEEQLLECKRLVDDPNEKTALARVEQSLSEVQSLARSILALDSPIGNPDGGALMEERDAAADEAIIEINEAFIEAKREMKEYATKANATQMQATRVTVIMGLLVVAIGLGGGCFLAKQITKPITQLVQATRRIASGDLASKADVTSQDEIGELATSFNRMTEELDALMQREKEVATAAAVAETEKKRAEELEREVAQRKRLEEELREKLAELEGFTDMAVARELKMVEMEKEMQSLKGKLPTLEEGREN